MKLYLSGIVLLVGGWLASLYSQTIPLLPASPFAPGEEMVFQIHYGPVKAGKAHFILHDTLVHLQSTTFFLLSVVGKTLPIWDWFYKVRDYYTSIADTHTLRPVYARRKIYEGGYRAFEKVFFHWNKGRITVNDTHHIHTTYPVYDLLSIVYLGRRADFSRLQKGHVYSLHIILDGEIIPVGAEYIGIQTIMVNGRFYECFVVKPRLVPGRVFKEQDDMTVYIHTGPHREVVRIESAIFVGYIQADLIRFTPGP